VGTLANGASATVTIHGTVVRSGDLVNTATVSSNETDTVPPNNTSTVTLVQQAIAGVPALSELGLFGLAMMLALAAVALRLRG
jgi:hypothetical protein